MKIKIFIPYGRVVEFRKWCQANPHIVSRIQKGRWVGYYGGPYHAREHSVYCTDPKYESFLRLSWHAGDPV